MLPVAEVAMGRNPVVWPESPLAVTVQVLPKTQETPFTVIDGLARAEFGIALAATAREGVVVELVTVGTSHDGHDPEGAKKLVTVPLPPPPPLKVQVVVVQLTPGPVKVNAPPVPLMLATPVPVPEKVQVRVVQETPGPLKVKRPK